MALGLVAGGRIAIYSGRAAEGLTRLDEAMAAVAAGEVSPEVFGNVYCIAIEGCQEIGALDRVVEWTSALQRWCDSQPGLVAFTGQCSVHRGQVMRQQGAWAEALEEFTRAGERYRLANTPDAIGQAEGERGDVLRLQGEYADGGGGVPARRRARLRPAARAGAAVAGARLARRRRAPPYAGWSRRPANPPGKCRLLPAAVDVLLAVGAVDEARSRRRRAGPARLGRRARPGCWPLSAYASGAVELAAGDASGALPYLRKARQLWTRVECPYEIARVRVLTGRALAALGDDESARHELTAALAAFRDLGAAPGRRGRRRAPRTRPPARRPDRPRGRGAAAGRLRPQQPPDRGRPGAQREDRCPPPLQHLRQARRRLPHRRRGVRLRARAGLKAPATADEVPELEGDVAGIGGSAATALDTRDAHYVTGQVVLDADDFGDIRNPDEAQAIVDHEFGHLVGLDHVDDPNELMHAEHTGQTSFGPGDLEGLPILGELAC